MRVLSRKQTPLTRTDQARSCFRSGDANVGKRKSFKGASNGKNQGNTEHTEETEPSTGGSRGGIHTAAAATQPMELLGPPTQRQEREPLARFIKCSIIGGLRLAVGQEMTKNRVFIKKSRNDKRSGFDILASGSY